MSTHAQKYGLLTAPILHTILTPKEKKKNNLTHHNAVQMFATKDIWRFQLKSLLKTRKKKKMSREKENNQKAFDYSLSALLADLLSNRLKSIPHMFKTWIY